MLKEISGSTQAAGWISGHQKRRNAIWLMKQAHAMKLQQRLFLLGGTVRLWILWYSADYTNSSCTLWSPESAFCSSMKVYLRSNKSFLEFGHSFQWQSATRAMSCTSSSTVEFYRLAKYNPMQQSYCRNSKRHGNWKRITMKWWFHISSNLFICSYRIRAEYWSCNCATVQQWKIQLLYILYINATV